MSEFNIQSTCMFLQERAKYAALLKNTQAEKEIKSIIETERQREQAHRINTVMKGPSWWRTKQYPNSGHH